MLRKETSNKRESRVPLSTLWMTEKSLNMYGRRYRYAHSRSGGDRLCLGYVGAWKQVAGDVPEKFPRKPKILKTLLSEE
jgi:hypothetical protein